MNGSVIREKRKELHLSQEELGHMVGMTQAQISKIEKWGTDHISIVKVFAKAFDMNYIELLKKDE